MAENEFRVNEIKSRIKSNCRRIHLDLPPEIYQPLDLILNAELSWIPFKNHQQLIIRALENSLSGGLIRVLLDTIMGMKSKEGSS